MRLFLTRYPPVELGICALGVSLLLVPAFAVPSGSSAHYGLSGAIIAVLCAALGTVSFLWCPRRPFWVKAATLALALPTLYFAVDAVGTYMQFVRFK